MKIIFEDRQLEDIAMSGGMCVVVPFEISIGKETSVTVFSAFGDIAAEFVDRFSGSPLADDALDFVSQGLKSAMDKAGYEAAPSDSGHLVSFTADGSTDFSRFENSVAVIKIEKTSEFSNFELPASMIPYLDEDDPCDVYFVAVQNGRIVSYAGVNDLSYDGALEINVETEDEYKRQGYGKAVCAALIEYLVSLGESIRYCCNVSNVASINLAKSLGIDLENETYSFVFYSKG